jgi:F-type H+-transporting ATPase subunit alpha
MVIYAATNKFLRDIPVNRLKEYEKKFLAYMTEKHPSIQNAIKTEKVLSDELRSKLDEALTQFNAAFLATE